MKFPSIKQLVDDALKTFLRFPFAIMIAIIGSFVGIILVQERNRIDNEEFIIGNLLHTCLIGLVFFISIDLFSEFKKFSFTIKTILRVSGTVILVVYYFLLPVPFLYLNIYRGILILLALHFMVSFIPFLVRGKQKSFWNFNQMLFLRGAISVVFSAILYIGIAIALGAANYLFELDLNEKIFANIWILIVGIFNTWFFLNGIPENFELDEESLPYPVFLKVLAQFILLPLVTLYFAILYVYLIKIIVDFKLPEGIISYMILGFSIAGILSLLLVYPLQDSEKNKWIRSFSKWFYVALIPIIILLFFAIGIRVREYGITENRYFIIVLATWLLGISIYMLIVKQKDIKIIPISLAVIAFLSSMGPLSGFSISKHSQVKQLEKILIEKGIYVDGKFNEIDTLSYETSNRIESIMYYLTSTHGYKPFQKFFNNVDLDSVYLAKDKQNIKFEIMDLMKLKSNSYGYTTYDESNDSYRSFYFTKETNDSLPIQVKDFDYFISYNDYFYDKNEEINIENYKLDSLNLKISYNNDLDYLIIESAKFKQEISIKTIVENIDNKYNETNNYTIPENEMLYFYENENIKIKLIFTYLEGRFYDSGDFFMSNYQTNILLKVK